ncbi:MAG TPA: hypothetical protein VFG10_01110 [Saprospiraceae bacterium]|nr:hypothetical protein [Saprospiraceae bacterium]
MKTFFKLLRRSALLLPLLVFLVLPNTHSTGTALRTAQLSENDCMLTVDGTQLVTETKQAVADFLHISPSLVTATYCCQLLDGRFKYSASAGNKNGFVYWIVQGDQIVVDDLDGF